MAQRRILLKLSGQLLCGPEGFGIDPARSADLALQIRKGLSGASGAGGLAVVLGAGNFLRGEQLAAGGMDRITGDQMGMLGTVMNALALRSSLEAAELDARVLSAIRVEEFAEPFIARRAVRHLEKGRVVLLAGGTGNPYFTTDTAAALRSLQIGASLLAKGTKVRGVFSDDPVKNPEAVFYERLSFTEALEKRLGVMDATAISLCRDNSLPIQVFNMWEPGNIERVLGGERIGTMVE